MEIWGSEFEDIVEGVDLDWNWCDVQNRIAGPGVTTVAAHHFQPTGWEPIIIVIVTVSLHPITREEKDIGEVLTYLSFDFAKSRRAATTTFVGTMTRV
jgi:hypothetical protein